MARIAITGASGFIGGGAASWLGSRGHEIIAVTRRLHPGLLDAAPDWEWIEWDLISQDIPDQLARLPSPDLVLHAATPNDILSRDVEAGHSLSISGTEKVLRYATLCGIPKFVFVSTFQVYGTDLVGDIDEYSPLKCSSHYALNHWFGEEVAKMHATVSGAPQTMIVRPANVYGAPWSSSVSRETLVPFCFCKQAIEEGRITLRSSGRQRRNFVHVSRIGKAVENLSQNTNGNTRVLNVASPHVFSIVEIAELVADLASKLLRRRIEIDVLGKDPELGNDFQVSGAEWDLLVGEGDFARQENRMAEVIGELLAARINKLQMQ